MHLRKVVAVFALFVLASTAIGQALDGQLENVSDQYPVISASKTHQAFMTAINAKQKEIRHQRMGLKSCLNEIGRELGISFYLDVNELDALGIDGDVPINFEAQNVSYFDALSLILPIYGVDFVYKNGTFVVTSESVVADTPVTLMYGFETDFDKSGLLELAEEIAETALRDGKLTPIIRILERQDIEPTTWLVVRANKYVHLELRELLSHDVIASKRTTAP